MKKFGLLFFFFLVSFFSVLIFAEIARSEVEKVNLFISGKVLDAHKEPIKEAQIRLLINERPKRLLVDHQERDFVVTSSQGSYQIETEVSLKDIERGNIKLEIFKTNFKKKLFL